MIFVSIVIAIFAAIFLYHGNTQFTNKGLFLATLSILLSLTVITYTTFGYYGIFGVNVALYLVVLAVKFFLVRSKK